MTNDTGDGSHTSAELQQREAKIQEAGRKALEYKERKHWRRPAKPGSAETAKQHLLETAIKMEGPFAAGVRDIVVSIEQGVPWSIADSRMRKPGNFSFTPETMKAYREWREAETNQ